MLKHRLILGPVLIAMIAGLLWLDERLDARSVPEAWVRWWPGESGTWPAGLVLLCAGLLIVPLAARELARIFRANGVQASRRWLAMAAMAGLLVSAAVPRQTSSVNAVAMVSTVGGAVLIASLLWHIRGRNLQGATAAVGAALFAFIYLGLMFGFILALRREHSAWVVLGVLAVAKSSDIGAYFTGTLVGQHKLIPWVSPGKTWEGLFGGLAAAAGTACLGLWFARAAGPTIAPEIALRSYAFAAVGGVLLGLTGQAGDLLASVLKRDAKLKDSGGVLPGFGGVLDVLDSVLLVAPVAFWLLKLP
ncbi:MAG: phosphatidate cytidylyltransferase [Phycisphaerales bacterium]